MSTLGEHNGNGIRFDMHLSAPNGGVAQMLCRPDGQWVSWNEYEKLKDENERLRNIGIKLAGYVDLLQAENERLRLAGNTMAQRYLSAYQIDLRNGPHTPQSVVEWNAAKEGKQP